MRAVFGYSVALLVGLVPCVSSAQEVSPVAVVVLPSSSDRMAETYDNTGPVAGSPLVGLRLGTVAGKLEVDEIFVAQPSDGERIICVRSTTQDGRYSAQNLYEVQTGSSLRPAVRLSPVTQAYGEQLAAYEWNQFAVRAFVARQGKCSPANAVHLPRTTGERDGDGNLVVSLNARSRSATASLFARSPGNGEKDVEQIAAAACGSIEDTARIAFDTECVLQIPDVAMGKTVWLRVNFDDGFTVEPRDYAIYLPRVPAE